MHYHLQNMAGTCRNSGALNFATKGIRGHKRLKLQNQEIGSVSGAVLL